MLRLVAEFATVKMVGKEIFATSNLATINALIMVKFNIYRKMQIRQ